MFVHVCKKARKSKPRLFFTTTIKMWIRTYSLSQIQWEVFLVLTLSFLNSTIESH